MKVNSGPRGLTPQSSVQGPSNPNIDSADNLKRSNGAARVSVSSLSQELSVARSAPEEVDVPKVERLRDSMRVGAFKIDHQQTVSTMVAEES